MMIKLIRFILIIAIVPSQAQNLVPNASFEEHTSCPDNKCMVYLSKGWTGLLPGNIACYYHRCAPEKLTIDSLLGFSVPQNMDGYQQPNSGDAYITIGSEFERGRLKTYAMCELKSTLKKHRKYKVSFYVSLGDESSYIFPYMRVALTPTKHFKLINRVHRQDLYKSHAGILFHNSKAFKDPENWHKVEGIYRAKGNERYLTIGVFHNDMYFVNKWISRIKKRSNKKINGAFYYIDDVSVELIEERK